MPSDDPDFAQRDASPIGAARRRFAAFVKAEIDELVTEHASEFLEYAITELQLLRLEIAGVIEDDSVVQLTEELDKDATAELDVLPMENYRDGL